MNILTYTCHLSPRDIGGGDGEGGWHHTRRANVLELVVVVVVARGMHCATCARVAAKRGQGGEGGHAYMNSKMNILTYPCHLSPRERDLEVVTWRLGAQARRANVSWSRRC